MITLLSMLIFFGAGTIFFFWIYADIKHSISGQKNIIEYDPDLIILVGIAAIFILLIINFFLLAKGIPGNVKSKIQNYSLIVALVSCVVAAPLIHRDIAEALLEAGYIRCGDYYRQRREEGSKSVFKKMAWVLDASDCAQVDAYPPGHGQ